MREFARELRFYLDRMENPRILVVYSRKRDRDFREVVRNLKRHIRRGIGFVNLSNLEVLKLFPPHTERKVIYLAPRERMETLIEKHPEVVTSCFVMDLDARDTLYEIVKAFWYGRHVDRTVNIFGIPVTIQSNGNVLTATVCAGKVEMRVMLEENKHKGQVLTARCSPEQDDIRTVTLESYKQSNRFLPYPLEIMDAGDLWVEEVLDAARAILTHFLRR